MSVRLSLAVAAPRTDPEELGRFLDALEAVGLERSDEVRIAASGRPGGDGATLRALGSRLPVGSLSVHESDPTPMRLWGFAMAAAQGAHIAVLEARGLPVPGWACEWSKAPSDRIVCGPVNPGRLHGRTTWAAYFSEYGQFLAPLERARLEEVPGNNVVFPRALLPAAESLAERGFWKTFHLERLRLEHGEVPLAVANGMVIALDREYQLGRYLVRRFLHGRCYAGCRLEGPGAPPRWLCLGFTPLLPVLRSYRVVRHVRAKPARTGPLGAAFPALVLGEIAWSLGELIGYSRGAGDACERVW